MIAGNKKKHSGRLYYTIALLAVVFILYKYLFEPVTIGYDLYYYIFIWLLPVLFGLVIYSRLLYHRPNVIFARISTFMTALLLSVVTFGLITNFLFNQINGYAADKSPALEFTCDVLDFQTSMNKQIVIFRYDDRDMSLRLPGEEMRQYRSETPEDYIISIVVRKGLFSTYLLDRYTIGKRDS